MKKLICMLALVLASTMAFGQAKTTTATATTQNNQAFNLLVDSLLTKIDSLIETNNRLLSELNTKVSTNPRYKLYKTENIYNLLRLDTKTGKIEQVQWSLDSSPESTWTINSTDYSYSGYTEGSFELYPTNNMYQFILIDTHMGRMWHVQWGIGDSKRWIRRIY